MCEITLEAYSARIAIPSKYVVSNASSGLGTNGGVNLCRLHQSTVVKKLWLLISEKNCVQNLILVIFEATIIIQNRKGVRRIS